jgi:hypothetical protein
VINALRRCQTTTAIASTRRIPALLPTDRCPEGLDGHWIAPTPRDWRRAKTDAASSRALAIQCTADR